MVIDWTVVLSNVPAILVSGLLATWIYKVLKNDNDNLRKQMQSDKNEFKEAIKTLEDKLVKSDEKASKWFRRYFLLANIIEKHHCKNANCKVTEKFNEFNEQHGEV